MKPTSISAEALFEAHREALRWAWIAGHAHPERRFDDDAVRDARSAADLVGYLNYIHPYRVQILGSREVAYLHASAPEDQERRISRIVTLEPPVLIVADGQTAPERLVAMCDRAAIPLFVTAESAGHVVDVVRGYLGQHFAERTTRHGVFMDILGLERRLRERVEDEPLQVIETVDERLHQAKVRLLVGAQPRGRRFHTSLEHGCVVTGERVHQWKVGVDEAHAVLLERQRREER